ncbi:MAG TPA: glycosyltransferase family 4 protein [Candidatus Hydrogenedens sp.]|nr:glycosyltransferase family 4 protein [Candidatus Hydrogenedens sp.]HOL20326.1 glycosyltransferase family 4 protein [Candidatus Hydrogenedens sp.]
MMTKDKKPLKILLTDPHIKGGGQITYICRLANGLTQQGHEVYVGCIKESIFVEFSKTFQYIPLNIFNFKGGLRPQSWLKDIRTFKNLLLNLKPDIIHANGSQDHWTSAIANELLSHRFCLVRTRHNTYPLKNHYFNRWLNFKCTDYHIAVCEMVRQNLIKQNNFPENRICSIHNGVNISEFKPDEVMRKKARLEFGFKETDVVCGISARLTPAKGHTFLLQAIKSIASECPEVKVLILGAGSLEQELKKQVKDLEITDRVVFAGYRKDMAFCTQAFDIAVLPSIDCDTSSFSLKEAMAEAKPVIASNYGGLPEIVSDGIEGIIVPAGTVEPLAKAIKELVKNPELRESMGINAQKRAINMFSLEQFINKTIEAYFHALEYFHARTTHR